MNLNSVPPVDKTFKLKEVIYYTPPPRRAMLVSLGCHVHGAINFWPDVSDSNSALLGVMKRIATRMPAIDPILMKKFTAFSEKFILDNMECCILDPTEDLSVEHWLEQTDYPGVRKEQLLRESEKRPFCISKDFLVKQHVKHESYTTPKHFRGIYSRVDYFKTQLGPIMFAIGKRFFKQKWFIKNIPMEERARFMQERFGATWIKMCSNDFTSFEATFVRVLMKIEAFFVNFCLQNRPEREKIMEYINKTKLGRNKVLCRYFWFILQSKRYSGEMDTSLMNSLMNLLFIVFLLIESGEKMQFIEDVPPVIEGDDSDFAHTVDIDETILVRLGANVKLEHHASLADAQFCKIIFDEDVVEIVTDPVESLLNFGYTNLYYLNASDKTFSFLIRAKSMSMIYTYPTCPILRSLAMYGLRVTHDVHNRDVYKMIDKMDAYKKQIFLTAFNKRHELVVDREINIKSRLLVESKFKVPVAVQFDIERYLDSLTSIQILNIPHLDLICDDARIQHFYNFSVVCPFVNSTF